MYNAPAVIYPVGRCRIQRVWMVCGWIAGGFVQAVWLSAPMALSLAQLAVALVWLVVGALLLHSERASPKGQLCWDGQQWRAVLVGQGECHGQVRLHLDGQNWLLLAWQSPQASRQWCWAERTADPARWNDFRRAVCAGDHLVSLQPAGRSGPGDTLTRERP